MRPFLTHYRAIPTLPIGPHQIEYYANEKQAKDPDSLNPMVNEMKVSHIELSERSCGGFECIR